MFILGFFFAFLFFILTFLAVLEYVFRATKEYAIMKDRNINYAWTAWFPCFGYLFFTYSYLDKIEEKHKLNNLTAMFFVSICFVFFTTLFFLIPFVYIFSFLFAIIVQLIHLLALNEAFETYAPKENGIIYILLYALCPISMLYTFTKLTIPEKRLECENNIYDAEIIEKTTEENVKEN